MTGVDVDALIADKRSITTPCQLGAAAVIPAMAGPQSADPSRRRDVQNGAA
jgi:hypothetical protein